MSLRYSFVYQAVAWLTMFANGGQALAQLPPTNMGKFVHTPGDNQYTDATQLQRHPVYQPPPPQQRGRMNLMQAQPAGPKIDVSIEPISCDEPIPVALFPPLPDRLDLPITQGGGSWLKSSEGGGNGGGGGRVTYHQNYGHVPMGARPDSIYKMSQPIPVGGSGYVPGLAQDQSAPPASGSFLDPGGGGGSMPSSGDGGGYKVRTESSPYRGTTNTSTNHIPVGGRGTTNTGTNHIPVGNFRQNYGSGNSQGYPGAPAYNGASEKDMRNLGAEPRLNGTSNQQSTSAPSPVVVTQSSTQDLSLPEDEMNYQYKPSSKKSNIGKGFGKVMKGPLNMVPLGF